MRMNLFLIAGLLILLSVSFVSAACPSSMVSYWKFDNLYGTNTLLDSKGENNLTLPSGGTITQDNSGIIANALSVGDGQYAQLSPAPANLKLTGDFTIEGWVKVSSIASSSHILGVFSSDFSTNKYSLSLDNNNNKITIFYSENQVLVSNNAINLNQWNHIALTKSETTFTIYLNGVQNGSATSSATISYAADDVVVAGFLGSGLTDELAIYDTALDAGTILNHYNYGMAGNDYCWTPVVVAETGSGTETSFFIPGCGEVKNVVGALSAGSCSADGRWFCSLSSQLFSTAVPEGCMGVNSIGGGGDDCCQKGFYCDETEGCVQKIYSCGEFEEKDDCEDGENNCIWWTEGSDGVCKDLDTLTCTEYKNETSCSIDLFKLGKLNGVGTNICKENVYVGTNMMVQKDSCACKWNSVSNNCTLSHSVTELIYVGDPVGFECQRTFETGECIEGSQTVTWTAADFNNGLTLGLEYNQALEDARCEPGSQEITCGEKIIRLPFFSFFNVISVVVILGIFYFFMIKGKNK